MLMYISKTSLFSVVHLAFAFLILIVACSTLILLGNMLIGLLQQKNQKNKNINKLIDISKEKTNWFLSAIAFLKKLLTIQKTNQIIEQFQEQAIQLQQAHQQLANKIREQQQTETALRESEDRYRDLFENANDLIQCVTPEGKFVYVNQAWKATLEYNDNDLNTLTIFNIIHPSCLEHCLNIFQRIMAGEVINEVEATFVSKSGGQVIVSGSINCKFVDGKPVSTRGIFRNITERKQAEAEIHYALAKERELIELKSRFITTASHEFRTPLTVILMSTKLLEKFGNQASEEKKQLYLERIQVAGNHMRQLLDDILLMSKTATGTLQFSPANLNLENFCCELIEQVQLSAGSKHTINFSYKGDPSSVYMDETLLRYILINILSNATKYSPHGGQINFELVYQPQKVIFKIQDQGIGIPENECKYLFDSFFRGSNADTMPGTGLGMSIVKQCVDLHGGEIAVSSLVGVGTTVTVTIHK